MQTVLDQFYSVGIEWIDLCW